MEKDEQIKGNVWVGEMLPALEQRGAGQQRHCQGAGGPLLVCSKLLLPPDLQAQKQKAEQEREAERKRAAERRQQMEDRIRGYEKAEKEWEAERERAAEKLQKMENRARRCEEEALQLRRRLWPDEGKQQSHSEVWSSTVCAQSRCECTSVFEGANKFCFSSPGWALRRWLPAAPGHQEKLGNLHTGSSAGCTVFTSVCHIWVSIRTIASHVFASASTILHLEPLTFPTVASTAANAFVIEKKWCLLDVTVG